MAGAMGRLFQTWLFEGENMIDELKTWWSSVTKAQKAGLIVLAAFVAAVLIMSFGVTIGSSLGKLF